MFNNISWTNYIASISLSLIAYYLIVGIKFYSHELRNLLLRKGKLPTLSISKVSYKDDGEINIATLHTQAELFASSIDSAPADEDDDDEFKQVGELTAKLKEAIAQAVDKNLIKEEFILSLQLALKKYAVLKNSHFFLPINNLIASECEKYGYIQLSAEERVMLWNE